MTAGRVVKNIPPKLVNFSAPLTQDFLRRNAAVVGGQQFGALSLG